MPKAICQSHLGCKDCEEKLIALILKLSTHQHWNGAALGWVNTSKLLEELKRA